MPVLRDMQAEFSANIFDRENPTRFMEQIRANGLSADRRIQIYRNNVYASLTEALRAVHPVVHKLVGDGFFKYAANEYITHYPSSSGDLHDFGDRFSEFLAGFEPAQSLAYLSDVARMEWYYHEAYHAAEHRPIDLDELGSVSPDEHGRLRLHLHPSARLLQSDYPVLQIWQVNQDHYDGEHTVDLSTGGIHMLVFRPDREIEFHTLGAGEYTLLEYLAAEKSLSESVEHALSVDAQFQLDSVLRNFVQTKTLVDFSVS